MKFFLFFFLDLADDSLKTRKKPNKLVVQQPEISEPQIQELNANVVFVVFKAYRNGEVEACIHAASASEKNVQRFSIDMQEMIRTSTGDEEQENMQLHISILETSVDHLRTQMTSILREADFAKEREAVFFEEVISMHEESRWWPIIHIVVLICAGFMQSQHIVTFFKNKHLI